jgi:hypothetical protein
MCEASGNMLCSRRWKRARISLGGVGRVAEKLVVVGVLPEVVAIEAGEQVVWFSNAGNLKIEFDAQRCPFSSNVFQAPPGVRVQSGPARAGLNPGLYKYRLSLNDAVVTHGEVLVRGK